MTANNPQAFPTPEVWGAGNLSELKRCDGKEGMTLRDYFAGQALIALSGIPLMLKLRKREI